MLVRGCTLFERQNMFRSEMTILYIFVLLDTDWWYIIDITRVRFVRRMHFEDFFFFLSKALVEIDKVLRPWYACFGISLKGIFRNS